ncbi:MAG: DUF1385 domain-containing protein [Myxococcota bacterium]|nr:DUF1385 domain-containing protein [Myxococcota bacterium]
MRPYIGGQAVLEGVMMRAPRSFAVVVRRADGSLHVRERAMAHHPAGAARWPLVRGVMSLIESLRLGSEALRFSVESAESDWTTSSAARSEAQPGSGLGILSALALSVFAAVTRDDVTAIDGAPAAPPREGARGRSTWLMGVLALAFFVALPQAAAAALDRGLGLKLGVQSAGFQALTGAFKLTIVVGYLLAIRRVSDIRRVFQYHGAEHKTISTYEAGEPLTVASARKKTTLHPRCGTTFLVMVALVSILVFAAVGATLPRIHTGSILFDNVAFFVEKLPFLPFVAALTFELQRLLARYGARGPLRALLWPGFLVQKITTAEPDDAQLEVALASLRVTLFRQEQREQPSKVTDAGREDVVFRNYEALLTADRLRAGA